MEDLVFAQNLIKRQAKEYCDFLRSHNDDSFEKGPEGKWNTSQHLDHLIKSTKPLNSILGKPKLVIRSMFGKSNRASRSYEALVNKYQSKLAEGPVVAPASFLPKGFAKIDKLKAISIFEKEIERLISISKKWSEKDADIYILPHPLLGKLTVREMLFFTAYHTQHHHKILEANYTDL